MPDVPWKPIFGCTMHLSVARAAIPRGAVLLLLSFAGPMAAATEIPSWSKPRAERLDRWRSAIAEAEVQVDEGRLERSEQIYREVVDEAESMPGSRLLLARALDGLADVCRARSRHEEAARLYARSAEMWESLLGTGQPRLATTLHNLGLSYGALDQPEEADRVLRRALAIWQSSLGPDSAEAENTRRALARLKKK